MTDTSARPGVRPRFSSVLQTERVGLTLLRVTDGRATRGYIEEVGAVFVALAGTRYDRCVEIAQSLTIDGAIAALSTTPSA